MVDRYTRGYTAQMTGPRSKSKSTVVMNQEVYDRSSLYFRSFLGLGTRDVRHVHPSYHRSDTSTARSM